MTFKYETADGFEVKKYDSIQLFLQEWIDERLSAYNLRKKV